MAKARWLKPLVGAVAFAPAAVVAARLATGSFGANPIAEALNRLGYWTLVVLLATLACTPLKILFGWNWPLRVRRLLGVSAFVYASLHLLVYVGVDQFFDWPEIWGDIMKRKFITVGFLAYVLMVPLAVTSTNKMVKRLSFRRWKRLHQLVYVIGVAGVVHFLWRVKSDLREPLIFGGVLAFLLAVRALGAWRDRRAAPGRSPAPSPPG
jgi:sulfoxide reductase heme-binding subunit YedZ